MSGSDGRVSLNYRYLSRLLHRQPDEGPPSRTPLRSRRFVSSANQPSIRFSHDELSRSEMQMPAGALRMGEPFDAGDPHGEVRTAWHDRRS